MHQQHTAAFSYGEDSVVNGLETNKTNYRSITLAGTLAFDGKCKGAKYSDPYGTYEDVVVQAAVKITLKTSYVPTHLEKREIILKSGTVCELKRGYCIDSDDGYSFWAPMPTSTCDFHQYDVLYQEQAVKMKDTNQDKQPTVYSLVTDEITFVLTTRNQQAVCGYTLLQTEHPKLFRDNQRKRSKSTRANPSQQFRYLYLRELQVRVRRETHKKPNDHLVL